MCITLIMYYMLRLKGSYPPCICVDLGNCKVNEGNTKQRGSRMSSSLTTNELIYDQMKHLYNTDSDCIFTNYFGYIVKHVFALKKLKFAVSKHGSLNHRNRLWSEPSMSEFSSFFSVIKICSITTIQCSYFIFF